MKAKCLEEKFHSKLDLLGNVLKSSTEKETGRLMGREKQSNTELRQMTAGQHCWLKNMQTCRVVPIPEFECTLLS